MISMEQYKSEVGSQKSEVRSRKSEVGSQKSEVKSFGFTPLRHNAITP